jgi:hypothetical protein
MITCHELYLTNPSPYDPSRKLPVGPTDLRDPGGEAFIASWQAHVDAGRIGVKLETPEEIRAVTLANERLICGDGRLPIW